MESRYKNHEAMRLFTRLVAAPSPPGREERMAAVVTSILEEMGYNSESDGAGNLTVRIDGRNPSAGKLLFSAHMDEIGMVVTAIRPDGNLSVDAQGGLYPVKIGEGPVEIVGDGEVQPGMLCMGSVHRPDADTKNFGWDDVFVATGLSPERLAEAGVRVGSSIVPARPTLVCFTVHEEGGCHGAAVLAQRERPEVFAAVDGSPIPPGCDLKLDGRPAIWSKDGGTNFDQRLIGDFCRAAREAGTELQVAVFSNAASDATKAYAIGAAERVATIGHVRENSHGFEMARLSVFDNLHKTLVRFLKTWQ